jgi:hypothetical protein
MCRRLKTRSPHTPVLVCVWQHRATLDELKRRLEASQPDDVVTRLEDALHYLEAIVHRPVDEVRREIEARRVPRRLDDGSHPPFTPSESTPKP